MLINFVTEYISNSVGCDSYIIDSEFCYFFQGYARFPKILQNFSERHILWSLYSVVFHALTLRLPIQTSLSVAPKLPVPLRSGKHCPHFRKTSTTETFFVGPMYILIQNWCRAKVSYIIGQIYPTICIFV